MVVVSVVLDLPELSSFTTLHDFLLTQLRHCQCAACTSSDGVLRKLRHNAKDSYIYVRVNGISAAKKLPPNLGTYKDGVFYSVSLHNLLSLLRDAPSVITQGL